MSHSKRNTSRAVFTSHERALAKSNWSSKSARLNRDSFLPFGSCGLCLEIARDPVSCHWGDIFCRECALANLLAQKQEIKRAEKARRNATEDAARSKAHDDEEDHDRAVRDFEMTQAGLAVARKRDADDGDTMQNGSEPPKGLITAGAKRKFELDEQELERIAKDDRAKARKAIEDEKAAKPSLPSFWTPSLTPGVEDSKLPPVTKKGKSTPLCPASAEDKPHLLSMHKLVGLHFSEDEAAPSGKDARRTCPSCLKALSNSSNPVAAEQCGHVLCLSCVKQFLIPNKKTTKSDAEVPPLACYVCDTPVTSKSGKDASSSTSLPAGLIELRSDGTGFSAKGTNTVAKLGVSFQC